MEDSLVTPTALSRSCSRFVLSTCAIVLAGFISGCSSHQGTLRLVSLDQQHEFAQTFSQAYYARSNTGDSDIVLIQDGMQPSQQDPTKPLLPDRSVVPRQLIHIRVFWTPMTGVKPDHPANTNASIHWCLICDNSNQTGMVEYSGSGLVEVDDSSDGATVTIRKAWMKVVSRRGEMVDPLGPSILEGSFHAAKDNGQVKAIISQLKAAARSSLEAQANSTN